MKAEGERRKAKGSAFSSFLLPPSSFLLAFLLGAATVLGYAPFHLFPLPIVTLAALFLMWRQSTAARSAATGFAYGMGLFLVGVSWVYVSLHDFGAMPAPLAALGTLIFCVILASLPALAGYLCARLPASDAVRLGVAAPALWMLTEWIRGWIFTGFPWLAVGYSQIPSSPLTGYAPVLGVYGVSLATAATAGLIAALWQHATDKAEGGRRKAEGDNAKPRTTLSFLLHPSSFILTAGPYLMASGFTGEPTAPVIGSAGATNMNS